MCCVYFWKRNRLEIGRPKHSQEPKPSVKRNRNNSSNITIIFISSDNRSPGIVIRLPLVWDRPVLQVIFHIFFTSFENQEICFISHTVAENWRRCSHSKCPFHYNKKYCTNILQEFSGPFAGDGSRQWTSSALLCKAFIILSNLSNDRVKSVSCKRNQIITNAWKFLCFFLDHYRTMC